MSRGGDISKHLAEAETRRIFAQARLPVMAAPMFLVSGPELVCACISSGIVGTYAASNSRDTTALGEALRIISEHAADCDDAPWGLNMIVHSSYDRFDAELELVRRYRPKIVTTALGSPSRVLAPVHGYGGIVLADVTTPTLARKAIDAGVDGLVLVSSGAGGHTGCYHPFAFIEEVRRFWNGPLGLAGAISRGAHIRAAELLGADFVAIGTQLIATHESMAPKAYRDMVVNCSMEDLELSSAVSGVPANWLKPTLAAAGLTPDQLKEGKVIDFSGDISTAPKAWKNVWSAGHGVGATEAVTSVEEVVTALEKGYVTTLRAEVGAAHSRMAALQATRQVQARSGKTLKGRD